ncbi:MAG: sugar phosphate nucleotidyltransferase [bacterium]
MQDCIQTVESASQSIAILGITPTAPETGYGYIQRAGEEDHSNAYSVARFVEKPDSATAKAYLADGTYLWNSGMFVWRAATLLEWLRRYAPKNHEGLQIIADAWDTPQRQTVLNAVYPTLPKISVDFAIMEPASHDSAVQVAAIPMPLRWLDVGSWPAFAQTCPQDAVGNALAAAKHLLLNSTGSLVASSDPNHLVVTVGCHNLLIIHTPDATLVCANDQAEAVKEVQKQVAERFGSHYV